MKIFLAYASAGMGHSAAAQALYERFRKDYPRHDVRILDILQMSPPLFRGLYSHGYYFLAGRIPFLWGLLYFLGRLPFLRKLLNYSSRLQCAAFMEYLRKEQPDAVVATHFFPAEAVSFLKGSGKLSSQLVCVITDFGVHPLWLTQNCDSYIVASEATCAALKAQGVDESKIKVFGIPVKEAFSLIANTPRIGLRALLVTGSFGLAATEKIVDALAPLIDLTVVCGRNRRLYMRLKNKSYGSVEVIGFTDQMALFMSGSDLLISKPGGLSIAEALVVELPMIFINGIPGQETANARILKDYGCAIISEDSDDLKRIITGLKRDHGHLKVLKDNISKIRKPNATEEICAYVCSGGGRPADRRAL